MRTASAAVLTLLLVVPVAAQAPDLSRWQPEEFGEEWYQGTVACGQEALDFWMQESYHRAGSQFSFARKLWSGDPELVEEVNREMLSALRNALADIDQARLRSKQAWSWYMALAVRTPDLVSPEVHQALRELISALRQGEFTRPGAWSHLIEVPGANGANIYGSRVFLTLGADFSPEAAMRQAGYWALRRELEHMNTSGDIQEFNCLESHWNGTSGYNIMTRYLQDPHWRRMARLIQERLWINRFLTWSPVTERITGPGSRMAHSEWLGTDNERFLFATGLERPIWLNFTWPWDGWDSRAWRAGWPSEIEAMLPGLPSYLQDLAWEKRFPHELQTSVQGLRWRNYPDLPGVPQVDPRSPVKYVNYQTQDYSLGSVTGVGATNTCMVHLAAFWNNSRRPAEAIKGSPAYFNVLYPHYVINGMSFLDQGDIYFESDPDQPLADNKGGPRGPWLREFIEFGRVGVLQHQNTAVLTYSGRHMTHYSRLVPDTVKRASAAMFFFRWEPGLEGLYVNREPVTSLPRELEPGDWWFIEDGDTYAAVRPLEATHLRGDCKTVLEERTRHIVLYQDNYVGESIEGISDEEWVQARSGFVVEMGSRADHGSFRRFQDAILRARVTDRAEGFVRQARYQRPGRDLEMAWHCFSEDYPTRRINGQDDPWVRYLQSPEFAVNDSGEVLTYDATLRTQPGKSMWLLSATPSRTWVAYNANPEQELPLDLGCPAGRITAARFPFGKLILRQENRDTVVVEVDATYPAYFHPWSSMAQAFQQWGILPPELVLETRASQVKAIINGEERPVERATRDRRPVWIINPYATDSSRPPMDGGPGIGMQPFVLPPQP